MKVKELKEILKHVHEDADVIVREDGKWGDPVITITTGTLYIELEED